jgi:hypothetical protein
MGAGRIVRSGQVRSDLDMECGPRDEEYRIRRRLESALPLNFAWRLRV